MDGGGNDALGADAGQLGGFGFDSLDELGSFELGLILDAADQIALGFFNRQAGNLLELVTLSLDDLGELLLALFDALLAVSDAAVAAFDFLLASLQLLHLSIDVLFLLLKATLDDFLLLATQVGLLIQLASGLEHPLLGLQVRLLE